MITFIVHFSDMLFRYTKYLDMVTSAKGSLLPEKLTPTKDAAKFHSLRCHLQVVVWKMLNTASWPATDWGWEMKRNSLPPMTNDDVVAPYNLLKYINKREPLFHTIMFF